MKHCAFLMGNGPLPYTCIIIFLIVHHCYTFRLFSIFCYQKQLILRGIYTVSYMGEYILRIISSRILVNVSDGSVRKTEASLCSSGVKGLVKGVRA